MKQAFDKKLRLPKYLEPDAERLRTLLTEPD